MFVSVPGQNRHEESADRYHGCDGVYRPRGGAGADGSGVFRAGFDPPAD